MDPLQDTFRWYLCLETERGQWTCMETTPDYAKNPDALGAYRSKVVLTAAWKPKVLDYITLHNALHPKIKIGSMLH